MPCDVTATRKLFSLLYVQWDYFLFDDHDLIFRAGPLGPILDWCYFSTVGCCHHHVQMPHCRISWLFQYKRVVFNPWLNRGLLFRYELSLLFFLNFRRFPEAGQTLLQDQHHGESIKVSVETQSFPNGELPGELRASNSNCFYFTSTYDRIKSCTEASVSFSISFNPHSLIGGVEISKERTVWNWFWSEGSEGWREILSHVSPFKDCISKLFLHLHTFCIGSCTRLIDILLLLYTSLKFLLSSKLWAGHFGVCGSAV